MCFLLIVPVVYLIACAFSGDLSVEVWPLAGFFVLGLLVDIIVSEFSD